MQIQITKKAEPPQTCDVNRDSGTDSANGGWLRRLVRRQLSITHKSSDRNLRLLNSRPNLLKTLKAAKLKIWQTSLSARHYIGDPENGKNIKGQPNKKRKQNHQQNKPCYYFTCGNFHGARCRLT